VVTGRPLAKFRAVGSNLQSCDLWLAHRQNVALVGVLEEREGPSLRISHQIRAHLPSDGASRRPGDSPGDSPHGEAWRPRPGEAWAYISRERGTGWMPGRPTDGCPFPPSDNVPPVLIRLFRGVIREGAHDRLLRVLHDQVLPRLEAHPGVTSTTLVVAMDGSPDEYLVESIGVVSMT
jgi:hypothetical protein